jgi:FAD/FMN-containing dehydrogenase
MLRRTFCQSAIAAAVTTSLSACGARQQASDPGPMISAMSMDGEELSIESAVVEELRGSLEGRLFLQADEGYDAAKLVWNGMFDHKRPAMVAQCTSNGDVASAVNFARERGLLLSVKCGGHSFPGKSTSDGGLMIDMSGLRAVDVDAEARTMRAGGGCLLGHLDDAATAHDLLTTTGIVAHTGAGGFTLGGGLGRTDRKMGLAIDNLLAATVVTANGDVVHASADENADLLWGLQGGGGNFGVVTEFNYRLHPFNPMVYGGDLFFDVSSDILDFFAEFNETLADEANVEPLTMPGPDGKPEIMIEVVWCGDHAAGEKALAPLLGAPGYRRGEFVPFPYRDIQTRLDAVMAHGVRSYLKSCFLRELTPEIIDIMVEYGQRGGPAGWWFQHMGGANGRVSPDATAYANRDAAFNFGMMYMSGDPAQDEAGIAAVREIYAHMEPHSSGFYTNLHDDTKEKTWGNFGENYPRLVELKNKYDPTNLFRLNANIKPTV